jgi:hypothetical protein
MPEKNFDFEPSGNSSGSVKWVRVHPANPMGKGPEETEAYFVMPDGSHATFIQGYLADLVVVEKPAIKEEKIPDRTETTLYLEISAEEKLAVSFSDHWKSGATAAVLNAIAGVEDGWDGFIRINLYTKDGIMRASCRNRQGDFFPNAYPFDQQAGRLTGVPSITETSPEEVRKFWQSVAKYCAKRFGRTDLPATPTAPATPTTPKQTTVPASTGAAPAKSFPEYVFNDIAEKATGAETATDIQAMCNRAKTLEAGFIKKYGAIPAKDLVDARNMIWSCAVNAGMGPSTISKDWEFTVDPPLSDDDLPF